MYNRIIACILFCTNAAFLLAQVDTVFWFAAPEAAASHVDNPIVLRITSIELPAQVTISQPANPLFPVQNITIPANTQQTFNLTPWIQFIENNPPNQVLNYGLKIESSHPISVFYEINSPTNPDIFVMKGQIALGTDFWIPSQTLLPNSAGYVPTPYSSFDMVATQDSTEITITPSQPIVGHPAGVPFTIVLNEGQTYSARALGNQGNQHLAGSRVISNKPVAITIKDDSMHGGAFGGGCADMGGDQIIPVPILGTTYIAISSFLNGAGDQLFIMAVENNTEVFKNGTSVGTLQAGQTIRVPTGTPAAFIESSAPVSVLQLSGYGCEAGISILPQINCSGSGEVYITRSTAEPFFVNVLVPAGGENSFLFNGAANVIPASLFQPVPGSNGAWLVAQISLNLGVFPQGSVATISNSSRFFHVGAIHGGPGSGTRFGYFSNYGATRRSASYATICEGESFEGYDTPGTYYEPFTTEEGCDSLRIVYLTIFPPATSTDTVVVCSGETFMGHNTTGVYTDTLTSFQGCDSIATLHLYVLEPEARILPPPDIDCTSGVALLDGSGSFGLPTHPDADIRYTWEGPAGGIQSGADSAIATVQIPGAYTLTVSYDLFGTTCTAQSAVEVEVETVEAPTIIDPQGVCAGTTVSYEAIPAGFGAMPNAYEWTVTGGELMSPAATQTTITWGAGPTGQICVVAQNPCDQSPPTCVEIPIFPIPQATLSGQAAICENSGDCVQFPVQLTGNPSWTLLWERNGMPLPPVNLADSAASMPEVCAPGTYRILSVTDGNGCVGSGIGTATLSLLDWPLPDMPIFECDEVSEAFTVSFNISGGDTATYTVNGQPLLGATAFVSTPIPTGQGFSFVVDDANGCAPQTLSSPEVTCQCLTSAGSMDNNLILLCADSCASALYSADTQVLDPNDTLQFILHRGAGSVIVGEIARNSTPEFCFDEGLGMIPGVTYYISAVVGDDMGAGRVNLADECTLVTPGTPVRWQPLPRATLFAPPVVCLGAQASVQLFLYGTGPFEALLSMDGVDTLLTGIPTGFSMPLTPTQTISLSLNGLRDLGTGCVQPNPSAATIAVVTPVSAGQPLPTLQLCQGTAAVIALADRLEGENSGGRWTETSAQPSSDEAFQALTGQFAAAAQLPGLYTFRYALSAQAPCPDVNQEVQVLIHPGPVANAGLDMELNCRVSQVSLGDSTTSRGALFTHLWQNAQGLALGNQPILPTEVPGVFTLTVVNTSTGCSASDDVVVSRNVAEPEPELLVEHVRCFGDGNGAIRVERVVGGVGPWLFSLDGGPFTTQTAFENLSAGNYTLRVQDQNGCIGSALVSVAQPAPVLVQLTADLAPDTEIFLGDSVLLRLQTSVPFDSLDAVEWLPAELIACQTCQENLVGPLGNTLFEVLISRQGCSISTSLPIRVNPTAPVFIPDVFSPNRDGINDYFYIHSGPSVAQVRRLSIFSRWGTMVFNAENFPTNEPGFGWDGRFQGHFMNPGVFVFVAEVEFKDGRVEVFQGDVTLVR